MKKMTQQDITAYTAAMTFIWFVALTVTTILANVYPGKNRDRESENITFPILGVIGSLGGMFATRYAGRELSPTQFLNSIMSGWFFASSLFALVGGAVGNKVLADNHQNAASITAVSGGLLTAGGSWAAATKFSDRAHRDSSNTVEINEYGAVGPVDSARSSSAPFLPQVVTEGQLNDSSPRGRQEELSARP